MWEVEWLIELASQYIEMTRNNLSIIWISLLAVSENDDSMGTRMCSEYSDDDGSKILNGDVRVIDILELSIK